MIHSRAFVFLAAGLAFALLAAGLPGCAGSPADPGAAAALPIGNPDPGTCPVMEGDEIDIEKAMVNPELHADYQGKRYLFCCKQCKPEFLKDPARYARTRPGA